MKGLFKKIQGVLVPVDKETIRFVSKKKEGAILSGEFSEPRNIDFHKKFFSLLDLGYGHFNPVVKHHDIVLKKNKEEFRKNIIILAGYYKTTFDIYGNVVLHAKSISFGRMKQDEFEKLYQKVIDVLLDKVLTNYTREEAEAAAMELIRYS